MSEVALEAPPEEERRTGVTSVALLEQIRCIHLSTVLTILLS